MAVVKNLNSYVTVAEANAYFEDRLDATAWTSASDTKKAQALITATSYLDELRWVGIAVSDSQTLAFPRDAEYFDPKAGTIVVLTNEIPTRILTATYELAFHLLSNANLLDDTGEVTNLSVGSISLSEIKAPNKISGVAKRLIAPLLENGGSKSWWRAN